MASLNERDSTSVISTSVVLTPLQDTVSMSPPLSPRRAGGQTGGTSLLATSQVPADVSVLRGEIRALRSRIRQQQADLQAEQDTVAALRKRTNNTEKERLNAMSRANEEMSRLDSESTKLRAQLEKGEAVRQTLEYELTKVRRELEQERRQAGHRENLMTEVNDSMKEKVSELTTQLEQLCEQLEVTKSTAVEENLKLSAVIEGKEKEISDYVSEKDLLEAERDRLDSALQQADNAVKSLEEHIREIEDTRMLDKENLRRQMMENDIMREREERNKADIESSQMKIKSLEENIEAERAAHLESKFNSEIIQLRIRDLEEALEIEKTSKTDASTSNQKLLKQISELQQLCEEEKRNSLQGRQKLEEAEKEFAILGRQLQLELEDKKAVIKSLSDQLDIHQQNFTELKEELSKAKKRQVFLEETYSGSMKELEVLVQGFQPQVSASTTRTTGKTMAAGGMAGKKRTTQKKKEKTQPAVLLESLRYLLTDLKRRLEQAVSDLTRVQTQNEALVKECVQHRELMAAKDKALQSSQQGMTSCSTELAKLRGEKKQAESMQKQLQERLRTTEKALDQAQQQNKDLDNQVVQLATECKTDEHASREFLQNVLQQLAILQRPKMDDMGKDVTTVPPADWNEMTILVNDRINLLLTYLQTADEKVKELELTVENRETLVMELQKVHEEQLQKLSTLTEDRNQQWQQEKQELEEHYSKLLGQVHDRQKKTQTLADQAWEKMRVTGSVQHSLEAECAQLRAHFEQCQREHDALLTACSLMCGAFYPLYARMTSLAAQRQLLSEQVTNQEAFRHQVQTLVEALSLDCKPPGVCNANLSEQETALRLGEDHALKWLTSGELLSTVVATMADLLNALEEARKEGDKPDSRKLVSAARSSFQKLICNLPGLFASVPVEQQCASSGRDRKSITRSLGYGLSRVLADMSQKGSDGQGMMNSQMTLSSLQQHIVEFTQRLHAAEVERRDLRLKLAELNQQRQSWVEESGKLEQMNKEVSQLQQQVEHTVDRPRFEQVCQELNSALRREQEAQKLLREQSQQIQELGLRLDVQATEGSEKERTLVDAVQGLSEAKTELRRQEQKVRQLNRQISQLETERTLLQENVRDAENALRTAAKDKDAITSYIRAVEKVLANAQSQTPLSGNNNPLDYSQLLAPDLIPSTVTKRGPELIACQTLVSAFVATHKHLSAKVGALQGEVDSHKLHVGHLKKELSDACSRQYHDEIKEVKGANRITPMQDHSSDGHINGGEQFAPLEFDNSMTLLQTSTPARTKKTGKDYTTPRTRSSLLKTPKLTGRSAHRKAADGRR